MAKRRKPGAFDPDYRTKDYKDSRFAPKNSSMSISQFSGGIAFLLFFGLYLIPEARPAMLTMRGVIIAGIGAFTFWIVMAILIRRLIRRKLQPKPSETLTFEDEPETQPIKADIHKAPPAPLDPIQGQLQARQERLQGQTEVMVMTPRDFEHEVAWLLNILTKHKAIVVGGSGDGGADVKVYDGARLVGIVQCKHYDKARPLSPGHVRELYAAKAQFRVGTAYLVTTAHFTSETRKEAKRLKIQLIDGERLEAMRKEAHEINKARDERQQFT